MLIIDDDPAVSRTLVRLMERHGWEAEAALTGEEGLRAYESSQPDLVLLDLDLPGMSGMNVLQVLVHRDATVVMLTGNGDVPTAVEAVQMGAENFLTKPPTLSHLVAIAGRALEKSQLKRANQVLSDRLSQGRSASLLGSSPRMQELAWQMELFASSDPATVLLLGESGTGKGWVAQRIHEGSRRARGGFVEVNCASLSGQFLESELFGHEKGAFTDAKEMKRGLFEVAHGGTLFLDEIGELALELQPKLLKVLEQKSFRRLGGTREITVDVRLIAATNRDLSIEVQEKRFREDLYYRLSLLPLTLPPLRERERGDVIELIHGLFADLRTRYPGSAGKLSSATVQQLVAYGWPGNVREMETCWSEL